MRLCGRCGKPTGRDRAGRGKQAVWCLACAPVMVKIFAAKWQETHKAAVRRSHRKYNLKNHKPSVVACITEGCTRTFLRGPRQGGRKFCDECAYLIFRPSYARTRKRDFPRGVAA